MVDEDHLSSVHGIFRLLRNGLGRDHLGAPQENPLGVNTHNWWLKKMSMIGVS